MKTSVLLLEKGCQNCAMIKVHCDLQKFENDTFLPKNDEKILLFFSSSSDGTKLFSEHFNCKAFAPILKRSDNKEITDVDEILSFLKAAGYYKA